MNKTLIIVAVSIGLIAGALFIGKSWGYNIAQAENLTATKARIEAHNKLVARVQRDMAVFYDNELTALKEEQANDLEVKEYLARQSDDPLWLDADGLRLWNQ